MAIVDGKTLVVEEINSAFAAMLGSATEARGKVITSFFAEDQRKHFEHLDANGSERRSFETAITGGDGKLRWLAWDAMARLGKWYLWGRDVTEIKVCNANLQKCTDQLEAVNNELEAFAYSVSHDLRAPLRAIHGNARAMEEDYEGTLDGPAVAFLKKIMKSATRMDRLMTELVAYSRMGRREVRNSPVDMSQVVDETFKEVSQAQPHRATFSRAVMPEAYGDLSMLRVVWTNLLSNAVKYSSKKEHPQIEAGGVVKDGMTEYFVRDNGAGFDMTYAGRLFGTFQRLHDDSEFEGIGIGLAIARRIIVKHGGTIRAEAQPEVGATFYFTLPGA